MNTLRSRIFDELESDELPEVQINGRYERSVLDDYWDAIWLANMAEAFLFQRSGRLVYLTKNDSGVPQVAAVTKPSLRNLIDRISNSVHITPTEDGKDTKQPRHPAHKNVDVMFDQPDVRIPVLRGIATTPVFVRPGELLTAPGYHERSGLYLSPIDGLDVADVPSVPTKADIRRGIEPHSR